MKLNAEGRLSAADLDRVSTAIRSAAVKYQRYLRYYANENPTLMDASAKKAPDNRVPSGFAGKIVDTMKGYAFRVGNIKYKGEGKFLESLKDEFDTNDEELLTAETATDTLVNGEGFNILRMDEDGKGVRIYRAAPGTALPVYDDTLARNMIAFVHLVTLNDFDDPETKPLTIRTTYYKDAYVEERTEGDDFKDAEVIEKEHPFDDVPAVPFPIGMLKVPLFNAVIPTIDEHDKIISSSYANEMERFANSYLLLLKRLSRAIGEDGKTDAERIAEIRIMDGLGDDGLITDVNAAAAFLTKPSRGADIAEAADRFERLIYDLAQVINPNDNKAGTALSGIAYRLKLLSMEFKAADIEAYFSRGLQRRIRLIATAIGASEEDADSITIEFQRNIPADLEALATIAGALKGVLSDETILGLFPSHVVPDIQEELKRLGEQADARLPALVEDMGEDVTGSAASEIQKTALNGSQISSLMAIVTAVATGTIDKATGIKLARAAFPAMSEAEVIALFSDVIEGAVEEETVE
jgi:SPP1 family phage portal protein